MHQLLITAVGPDRPGLVDTLTGYLLNAGANVADSRMVNLRGRFAVILLAQADQTAASTIEAGVIEHARRAGLIVTVDTQPSPQADDETTPEHAVLGVPYRLRIYGMDQPGIVHRVANLLSARGVNIENLETSLATRTYGRTPVFSMTLTMTVPQTVRMTRLTGELDQLCDSLNVSHELEPV